MMILLTLYHAQNSACRLRQDLFIDPNNIRIWNRLTLGAKAMDSNIIIIIFDWSCRSAAGNVRIVRAVFFSRR